MKEAEAEIRPPKIVRRADGTPEPAAVADLIEWFLNFDERTMRIRHPHSNELFQWKQLDDQANGAATYPFENAEARFAIGTFQAITDNNSEPMLGLWLNDVLTALDQSRNAKSEITELNKLDPAAHDSPLVKAEKLTTNAERRLFLSSCWLETLFTAEARVLGWVYQELYGRPFTPAT